MLPDHWTAAPKVNRETHRNGDNLRFGGGMRKFKGCILGKNRKRRNWDAGREKRKEGFSQVGQAER